MADQAPILGNRSFLIPTNMISDGLLSPTSHAYTCFTQQQFSAMLQAYLVTYVMSVTSYYSVYK